MYTTPIDTLLSSNYLDYISSTYQEAGLKVIGTPLMEVEGTKVKLKYELEDFRGHGKTTLFIYVFFKPSVAEKTFRVGWRIHGTSKKRVKDLSSWENELHDKDIPGMPSDVLVDTEPFHWHYNPTDHYPRTEDYKVQCPENVAEFIMKTIPEDYKNKYIAGNILVSKGMLTELPPPSSAGSTSLNSFSPRP